MEQKELYLFGKHLMDLVLIGNQAQTCYLIGSQCGFLK